MRFSRSKLSIAFSLLALVAVLVGLTATWVLRGASSPVHAANAAHTHLDCSNTNSICAEVGDPERFFGKDHYVGHDEPSTLFYSNAPGSGNRMRYALTLPKDPTPTAPLTSGKSYNFQLHPALWFGMALCDTQSFPELVSNCTPNSDKNIVDPAVSPNHPGTAFVELQFYPPGWAPISIGPGISCDATKWCAAMALFSVQQNALSGQFNNADCQAKTGVESANYAFITRNGVPHAPPDPLNATPATFAANPATDLFMGSGDQVQVTLHDTPNGLITVLNDTTTGQSGFMTASAANGFAQVDFKPKAATCTETPYNFHPMYSTSSEKTRVTWAAHSYNIAFSDEIGHWDYCTGSAAVTSGGNCPTTNKEGNAANTEQAEGGPTKANPAADDTTCSPSSVSLLVKVTGCQGQNNGFDGSPYQPVWPDGNTTLHPTSVQFTSPLTGVNYNVNYSRFAFEADLPRIEFNTCNRASGVGCTLIPTTDDGTAAAFYPFFSIGNSNGVCTWRLGNHIPGSTNDFHQNQQYGTLLNLNYTAVGGGVLTLLEDFRQVFSSNPCQAMA